MQRPVHRLALTGLVALTSLAIAAPATAEQLPQQPLSVQFADYVATQPLTISFSPQQTPPQAQTQGESDPGMGFGISAGITQSKFTGDIPDFFGSRTGYLVGLWLGGNRDGRVGVGFEANYVQKGASTGGDEETTVQYVQLLVPIRLNAGSSSRNSAVFYGVVGPSINIKIGESGSLDLVGDYEGFDLGIFAGAGLEVTRVGVEVRGEWGLLNAFDPGEGFDTIRTFSIQALVKLRIN